MKSTVVRRARVLGAAGAALLIAAVIVVAIGVRAQRHAPQPLAAAASPVNVIPPTPSVPGSSSRTTTTRGPILTHSTPTRIDVPAINVHDSLLQIGLDAAGMIQTPPLGPDSHPYWLTVTPTPGQLGPATIIGHVDSAANGPAVFFRLGALRQRDPISITRADGMVAVFAVERVVEYPKAQFPTLAVYGNLDHAGLRLITCGGIFNAAERSYESNIVVYASLVSTHHA